MLPFGGTEECLNGGLLVVDRDDGGQRRGLFVGVIDDLVGLSGELGPSLCFLMLSPVNDPPSRLGDSFRLLSLSMIMLECGFTVTCAERGSSIASILFTVSDSTVVLGSVCVLCGYRSSTAEPFAGTGIPLNW